MQRFDIDDPDVDIDFGHRLLYRGQPISGEVEEYQRGVLISREEYSEGIRQGPTREWHRDGTLKSEGFHNRGVLVGEFREWHPNGVPAKLMITNENGTKILTIREWDSDGNPTKNWEAEES